jgi:ABC-type nitrate/sulfonate/bicarbonate transport system permease component
MPDWVLGPSEIARAFATAIEAGDLLPHIAASLTRSLPGFVLGTLAGVALGLLAGVSRLADAMLSPSVFLSYPVPKIVMLPIVMVWFGIGDASKVVIIALACFYPAFINAYYGARSTRVLLVWSALNMGARPRHLFWKVVVPSALPMMLSGVRIALALSFILLFAAEMVGARSGLGYLIKQSENSLRFDLMYVSIITIAVLGSVGDALLRTVGRRLARWQEQQRA